MYSHTSASILRMAFTPPPVACNAYALVSLLS
nr:MAG TPA: hypothetical protein [Caudoviricetes sp.]